MYIDVTEPTLCYRQFYFLIGTMNKNSVFQVQENVLWMKVLHYTWKDMRVNLRLIELYENWEMVFAPVTLNVNRQVLYKYFLSMFHKPWNLVNFPAPFAIACSRFKIAQLSMRQFVVWMKIECSFIIAERDFSFFR